jgi:hypothetical protein
MTLQKYTNLKSALKKAKINLPKTTNVLEIGCLHSIYNEQLRKDFETAGNKKRTVHIVGCDFAKLKHLKKGKGTIKSWDKTHKHTEVLVFKDHTKVKHTHKRTKKKHLKKKNQYHILFSIRPDLKNQKQWFEVYTDAWNQHKKENGTFILYIAKNKGEAQKRKLFIERVKKKLNCQIAIQVKASIPLSDAELIIFR